MKVVALLSGGKDSCFNLMHCVANGHEIVAVANLYSEVKENKEEIDSFMYQTVGSNDIVPLVAECLGLPLFRKLIAGKSVSVDMEYTINEGDEVEDLMSLLLDVKSQFPEVNAVSVGAILSNYQRIRVEHVCSRLGLTPLAYLWQSDQSVLLQSMLDNNLIAVLAKVAAMGLDTRHLGKTLGEMQPLLEKLSRDYGCHVAGEGGEYETLTLDCPLFRKRIVLIDQETIIHSNDAFAIVAYLKFKKVELVDKPESEIGLTPEMRERLLEFGDRNSIQQDSILKLVKKYSQRNEIQKSFTIVPSTGNIHESFIQRASIKYLCGFLAISNISSKESSSVEQETTDCMNQLSEHLQARNMSWKDVVMMHLFVADMNEFSALNKVYGSFLGTNPPTRVTVEVSGLLDGRRIQMDCLAFVQRPNETALRVNKSVMHVQGVSYWAPSNIGPYSQTIKLNDHLYVAGQIGLIPHTMELPSLSTSISDHSLADLAQAIAESQICFSNLESIASVQGCEFPKDVGLLICFVRRVEYLDLVKQFCNDRIKNFLSIPSLFLSVAKLPRNCAVEFQVMFQCPNDVPQVDDSEDSEEEESAVIGKNRVLPKVAEVSEDSAIFQFPDEIVQLNTRISAWNRGSLLCMTGEARLCLVDTSVSSHHIQHAATQLLELIQKSVGNYAASSPVSIKVFYRKDIPSHLVQFEADRFYSDDERKASKPSISYIPVDFVSVGNGVLGVHVMFPHLS
ncbi:hypothetical protein BDR26DRAFT_817542 [Obelidium mucronatum]|nr:hypothetical protein BDR26DRAFT_844483 [Obelidium mucronatum]KAI9347390.1 hypothetical protein BDR26DRAFT_817542 [Obelidium mucronatum]